MIESGKIDHLLNARLGNNLGAELERHRTTIQGIMDTAAKNMVQVVTSAIQDEKGKGIIFNERRADKLTVQTFSGRNDKEGLTW